MRIQIFQIKCSEWGGQAEPWKHIRFIPPVLFTGPRNIGCKQNANSFDWIRWCRGNCIWRNVQDFFFSLLLSVGEGCFMKSILNKSYHRPQALRHSFVICGCGCVFNFLSIKSKYAVFFFLPPMWNLNKRSQHQPTGEEYSFCCCLIQQAQSFFAFFPLLLSEFFSCMFSKHLIHSKLTKKRNKVTSSFFDLVWLCVSGLDIELDCCEPKIGCLHMTSRDTTLREVPMEGSKCFSP